MKNNKIIISTVNSKYEILIGSNLINKLDWKEGFFRRDIGYKVID